MAIDEGLLRAISGDRALASAVVFPHRHPDESPLFHIEIMDLWGSKDELVCIEGFRECAKSTLSEEFIALEACFHNFEYAYLIGETWKKACQRLEAIKYELNTNPKILALFGVMKGTIWNEDTVVLTNGVKIQALGWDQEIRGEKHLSHRPDRAYLDDVENKTNTRDSAAVDGSWKKLWKELRPAMDTHKGKIRITGTPLANDCLINRCKASPDFVFRSFPICNGDIDADSSVSLWESRYPMSWIRAERDKFANAGLLREFMQEYMMVAAETAGKPFEDDQIVFQECGPTLFMPRKLIVDPARTVNVKTSDQTGYVVASKSGSRIYVWESGAEFWKPDQIVDHLFECSKRHDFCEVDIEQNSLNEWLLQPIRAQMLKLGQTFNLVPINAPQDRDKVNFILGLQPFFKAHDVIFVGNEAKHKALVQQIKNFPSGKRDAINALAYVLRVFAGSLVYPDFADKHIVPTQEVPRGAQLLLGANATMTETAVVLCALDGPVLTVLADWVSPLPASDCIPDIARAIRVGWPNKPISAWVSADQQNQIGRNPLITALKNAQLRPASGDYAVQCRSSIAPLMRQEVRRQQCFQVMDSAQNTLQALSSGYTYGVKPNGDRSPEPDRNAARTLIEALEVLTYALNAIENAAPLQANATTVTGSKYFSALPNRR